MLTTIFMSLLPVGLLLGLLQLPGAILKAIRLDPAIQLKFRCLQKG
jgi:hypothetical protein